jgi:hypothetical protein
MQAVPPARLEGVHNDNDEDGNLIKRDSGEDLEPREEHHHHHSHKGSPTLDSSIFIVDAPDLDSQIRALHTLARTGRISAETAERQINTFLLAAAPPKGATKYPRRWLVLPLTDAPHHSLMPDLGHIIHRVLARDPVPCTLSMVIEQCIPRFRHACRPIRYTDCQPVFLMLVMGLLLGLYPGNVKKPGFRVRAALFRSIHGLMTSTPEEQTAFCSANEEILLLACMEYLARIPAVHMPVQNQVLAEGDPTAMSFFRRIPALGDELRQWMDEQDHVGDTAWEPIRLACSLRVERVSRLKRGGAPASHQSQQATGGKAPPIYSSAGSTGTMVESPGPHSLSVIRACWNAPALLDATLDEYRLLGLALGLPGPIIQRIQQEVRVFVLPRNLMQMQIERLRACGPARARSFYLQSHWTICMCCLTTQKSQTHPQNHVMRTRLRLDTLTQALVCATCLSPDPVCVNMLGRVMLFHKTHYYLCPSCATVQPYRGGEEQPWLSPGRCGSAAGCVHVSSMATALGGGGTGGTSSGNNYKGGKRKENCFVCGELALIQTVRRVDHLTGHMLEFHYCQRHTPRPEMARKCLNAKQLAGDAEMPRARPLL